jgi:hypothetical protein
MIADPLAPEQTPEPIDMYHARRQRFNNLVLSFLGSEHPTLQVRGSFARGDFHLQRHESKTYSDIDLILPGVAEVARHVLADEVSAGLAERGINLPVSVQPLDVFSHLPPHTSRYAHLGEYLRRSAPLDFDDPKVDYLRAKLSLNLIRAEADELPPVAAKASEIKVGLQATFSSEDFLNLVPSNTWHADERPYIEVAAGQRQFDRPLGEAYVAGLNRLSELPVWLRSVMTRLVVDVLP